ncbi:MAG: MFS transporter [Streptosporangiaceae bacterium]
MAATRERRPVAAAVVALCLVQFVDVLGVTVIVTALPSMLADLHAPQSLGGLMATGYAMSFGGLLMLGARLGDRYGHRRTILVSLAVFAAGAAMTAAAESVAWLTAGRWLQGAAAAAVPSALRLLTTVTTEGPARRRAIALWSAAGAAAGASGFVVDGVVTDLASWRLIFWVYVPLAGVLAAVIAGSVPRDLGSGPARSLNLLRSAVFAGASWPSSSDHGHQPAGRSCRRRSGAGRLGGAGRGIRRDRPAGC